jgi:hypothetical protein
MSAESGETNLSNLTKTNIKLGLSAHKYVVIPNVRAKTADIWVKNLCGLIALKPQVDEMDAEPQLIPGYAACFKCEEVFSYVPGASHSQLTRHVSKCFSTADLSKSKNIGLMDKFVSRKLSSKLEKSLLEACATFVSVDMQSFKSLEGQGLSLRRI